MEPAKVLLVDDHALFRHGVRAVIDCEQDLRVVGEAEHSREALAQARELHPDLILMDINLPDGNGLAAVYAIKRELPEVKIVVLTVHDDDESLFEAIKGGVDGFLSKDVCAKALLESLRGVIRGEAALSRRMAAKVLQEFVRLAQVETGYVAGQLTPRETQVLCRISKGLSNKEIARTLRISENTVKIHITHILKKLHVCNRSEAAAYAQRLGLIEESG